MKHLFVFLAFCIAPFISSAQECNSWYTFSEGTEVEITSYDKKGRVSSINAYDVVEANQTDEGLVAFINFELFTDEGEELSKGNYEVTCKENSVYLDMSNMLAPQLTSSFNNMEVEITGDQMVLPENLTPGLELDDATTVLTIGENSLLTMRFSTTDRKVEKIETIETPAGKFECAKITQKMEHKMGFKKVYSVTEWYAKGIGMIRSEYKSKKGKVMSTSEMTKYKPGS